MKASIFQQSGMEIHAGILVRCNSRERNIVIPHGVIGIADDAFGTIQEIPESVQFPESLLWIGNRAFSGCRNIRQLVFPKSLVEISDSAFCSCTGIKSLVIPENVYRIGNNAFSGCHSLESVCCSEGLVKIGRLAFAFCEKLKDVSLPRSCAFIEKTSFLDSKHVVIHAGSGSDAELYAEMMGIAFQRVRQRLSFADFQAGFEADPPEFEIRNNVLVQYNGSDHQITIPESVKVVSGEAFRKNSRITSVEFLSSTAIVGTRAFSECGALESVSFSGGFLYLSGNAFYACTLLKYLGIDGGVHIGSDAFCDCTALDTIILPDKDVYISDDAFYGCDAISRIKLPLEGVCLDDGVFPAASEKTKLYISCFAPDMDSFGDLSAYIIVFYHFEVMQLLAKVQYCKEHNYEMLSEELPSDILKHIGEPPEIQEHPKTEVEADVRNDSESAVCTAEKKDYKSLIPINGMLGIPDCDILLDGEVISGEQIMRQFMKYVIETIESEGSDTGIVLHTGSSCFHAVLLAVAAVKTLLLNSATPDDILDSLLPGDIILYEEKTGQKKYIFDGKIGPDGKPSENYITLRKVNKTKDRNFIPKSQWHRIIPYYGSSDSTSDAGLRRNTSRRHEFYDLVLGISPEKVPKTPNTSLVVVLPKSEAAHLMHCMELQFRDTRFKLSEIATAGYYTEGGITYFAGNPGKTEPVIKFTDNVYVARRLASERDGNTVVGTLILGADYLKRSYAEVFDLLVTGSVVFRYGAFTLSDFDELQLLDDLQNTTLFAVTPEYVSKHLDAVPDYLCSGDSHTDMLLRQQGIIRKRKMQEIVIPIDLSEKDYFRVRRDILEFKHLDFDSDEKILFVQEAFSALNLLMTAVFPVDEVAEVMHRSRFLDRIQGLRKFSDTFYPENRRFADEIIESISILYYMMGEKPKKQDALQELLEKYAPYSKKTALVVPKAYYATILYEVSAICRRQIDSGKLVISTATRFDSHREYCAVIYISNKYEKMFAPQRCFAAADIVGIMYDCEQKLFAINNHRMNELYRRVNRNNYFPAELIIEQTEPEDHSAAVPNEDELNDYIEQISRDYLSRSFERFYSGSQGMAISNITTIVGFETGERALLTKRYAPYVFDESCGKIVRPNVDRLSVGDLMVFNTDYFGTRDIVDTILEKELSELPDTDELHTLYRLSNHWKNVLREYIARTGKKEKEIASDLKMLGVSVEIPTILGWLDPDSHTVRPRDPATFQQIGFLVSDSDLFMNPDRYIDACSKIQSKRNRILHEISVTMVSLLNGSAAPDAVPENIREMIGELSQTYRISSIIHVDRNVPSGITNHPIDQFDI